MRQHRSRLRRRMEDALPLLAPEFPVEDEMSLRRSITMDDVGVSLRVEGPLFVVLLRCDADGHERTDLIEDALDAQSDRTGNDHGELAPAAFTAGPRVDGDPRTATGTRRGAVWSMSVPLPPGTTGLSPGGPVTATLAGWNVEPDSIALTLLTDLDLWLRGWEALMSDPRPEEPAPPRPAGDGPTGRAAIRALIDQVTDRRPQPRRTDRAAMRQAARSRSAQDFWPAATLAVSEATGLDEYDGAAALARVVNELAELFTEESEIFGPAVRERATEESIDQLLTGARPTTDVQLASEALRARDEASRVATMGVLEASDALREAWLRWATDEL